MSELMHRLTRIYGAEIAPQVDKKIQAIIEKYRRVSRQTTKINHQEVVLISYGDSLVSATTKPLQTLNDFLQEVVGEDIPTVHILPFYPYSSDDGFSVIDYWKVNPELGDWVDIERLTESKRLMFDAVINHISRQSDWVTEYAAGTPGYEDFFIELANEVGLEHVVRPRTSPLLSPFVKDDGTAVKLWTTFSDDQIDLNYGSTQLMLKIIDLLLFYVEKGAALIRLDAIAFMWKELETSCVHLPQTHEIIKLFRDVLAQVDDKVLLITETNVPHQENISYFGRGDDEAHLVYNFALPPLLAYSVLSGNALHLSKWCASLNLPGDQVCFFNFTASHDGIGVRSVESILSQQELALLLDATVDHGGHISYRANQEGGKSPYELNCNYMDLLTSPEVELSIRIRRMLLSQYVSMVIPGVPAIYIHSLLGSSNDHDGVKKTGALRSINREKLNYEAVLDELQKPQSQRAQIYAGIIKGIRARKASSAFDPYGKFKVLNLHEGVFAILRYRSETGEAVLALNNFTPESIQITLPQPVSGCDLLSATTHSGNNLVLTPYQVLWISHNT